MPVSYTHLELDTEDLITPTDMVVTLSHGGYIKSQPLSEYRSQKRGGRGKQATAMKENDWIDQLFIANTHAVSYTHLPQLRRQRARTATAALAPAEPAGQRQLGHRGRHGHQHSAPQPPGSGRRLPVLPAQSLSLIHI